MKRELNLLFIFISMYIFILSVDGQQNIWHYSGLAGIKIQCISIDPLNESILYAGSATRLYKSYNSGLTWDTLANSYGAYELVINPQNNNLLYAAAGALIKSIDGGYSWFRADSGIYYDLTPVTQIAIDPNHPDTLYAGEKKLYRTFNGAISWEKTGLYDGIEEIVVRKDSSHIIYASTAWACFTYRSEDRGNTWVQLDVPWNSYGLVSSLILDPKNKQIIYAGVHSAGFYKSVDEGVNWDKFGQDIVGESVSSLIQNPVDSNELYLGSDDYTKATAGVYYSNDAGATWRELKKGLRDSVVYSLVISSDGEILYAGTGNGVYKYDLPVKIYNLKIDGVLDKLKLYQNYPNPFNNETKIEYFLPSKSFVNLSIFDIQGRHILSLFSDIQSKGLYNITWNGLNQAGQTVNSGIYIYTVTTSFGIQCRKLIILK